MPISQEQINMLEDFMSSSKKSTYPSISTSDLKYGKQLYNRMLTEPGPDYRIIGSDGSGYICYGIYKSKEDKLYIVTVSILDSNTEISSCILIKDEKWFD